MSNIELIDALFDAGLVQFGAFEQGGRHAPFWVRLDMMPSYPNVMRVAAEALAARISPLQPDRLVCAQDSIALAALVSQKLNVPLVVHSGTLGNPARNLIGAYDIGHPSVLISLSTDFPAGFVSRLVSDAASVGLNVTAWFSLLEMMPINEIRHIAAISLRDMADRLVEQGELSASMAAQIRDWG